MPRFSSVRRIFKKRKNVGVRVNPPALEDSGNSRPSTPSINNETPEDTDFDIKPDPDDCNEIMINKKELMKSNTICIVDTWNSMFTGTICCIYGCTNTTQNCKERAVDMYPFPNRRAAEKAWISAIRELNCDNTWERSTSSRICSEHFIGGKKSDIKLDLSYIPTIRGKLESEVQIKCELDNYTSEVHEYSNTFKDAGIMCDMYSEYKTETLKKFEKLEKLRNNLMNDDCQIFCNFVANEMRNIKPELRQRLKACIQKSVLEFSEKNDQLEKCIQPAEENDLLNRNVHINFEYKQSKS